MMTRLAPVALAAVLVLPAAEARATGYIFTELATPDGGNVYASSINASGEAVGTAAGGAQAVYWNAAHAPSYLAYPAGATQNYAAAINASGEIAGESSYGSTYYSTR
jgi:hypothetical protein